MIDTHCHFDFPPFSDDPHLWLENAKQAGVEKLIIPSVKQETWRYIKQLSASSEMLYYSLGLHPVWIAEHQEIDLEILEKELIKATPFCVAIGEIGLDFSKENAQKEKQSAYLSKQLALAEHYQYPVILHCRKAQNELLQILNKFPRVRGVLHGFSGSEQIGLAFIKRGFLLGIGGSITYPRANKTRQAVAALPLSSLVLETDAPDMPLYGCQGKPNTPEALLVIAKTLAVLKNQSIEKIIKTTSKNALQCFSF